MSYEIKPTLYAFISIGCYYSLSNENPFLLKIKMLIVSFNLYKLCQLIKSIVQMKGDFIFRRKKRQCEYLSHAEC
ncbi:unnamed protein product [Blepharisma stoltei]|uniref:Uncharacterized protein n=1 Tax=Blepharisma stoltei TaxID=1481888 RepID=A0AAU9IBB5_9CILI|nr:unnamed protein product [Blepharisma stoltei]